MCGDVNLFLYKPQTSDEDEPDAAPAQPKPKAPAQDTQSKQKEIAGAAAAVDTKAAPASASASASATAQHVPEFDCSAFEAEVEVMIAEPKSRRKGLAREALTVCVCAFASARLSSAQLSSAQLSSCLTTRRWLWLCNRCC